MIAGMVESLAARLDGDPGDANGWARLIRSYMVLDRVADARAALVRARSALASDAGKLAIVDSAAREAGLVD
jgi:cytochrome c-type biogenesis protein CcmH